MKAVMSPVQGVVLGGAMLAICSAQSVFAQGTLTPEQLSIRVERLTELSQRYESKAIRGPGANEKADRRYVSPGQTGR